jgi:hypothetical protein
MIPHGRTGREQPGEDLSAGARCALLDDYWAELQRHPEPDSRSWLSDRGIPDQTIIADLDILKLLHRFRRLGTAGDEASQAGTVVVSEPFGLSPPAPAPGLVPEEGRDLRGDRVGGPAPNGEAAGAREDHPGVAAAEPVA